MSGLKIFKIGGYPLESQIALINPKIIVTLGNIPTQFLLETTKEITKLRGNWFDWLGEIKIFPMFHPSYLLRNESTAPSSPKAQTWKDIQTLKEEWKIYKNCNKQFFIFLFFLKHYFFF